MCLTEEGCETLRGIHGKDFLATSGGVHYSRTIGCKFHAESRPALVSTMQYSMLSLSVSGLEPAEWTCNHRLKLLRWKMLSQYSYFQTGEMKAPGTPKQI